MPLRKSAVTGAPPVAPVGASWPTAARRPVVGTDPAMSLEDFFRDPPPRDPPYPGQLARNFQQRLARHHRDVVAEDCDFYHTIDLGGGRVYPGAWDLRGHEAAYLGHEELRGRRVIEFGPASGWLSAHMALHGARLVTFDLPPGKGPLVVPLHDHPHLEAQASGVQSMSRLRNSWWFTKSALGFAADAVYGDIFNPPSDIGRVDVAVFGAILLHLPNPFLALRRAADMTDDTIIVTDVDAAPGAGSGLAERDGSPTMLVTPTSTVNGLVHWWSLSPAAVQRMLAVLGFTDSMVTLHSPPAMASAPALFTVVAHRPGRRAVQVTSPAPQEAAATEPKPPPEYDLPPPHVRFLVAGTEDTESFLALGRRAIDALLRSLQNAGIDPAGLGRVLDFGCGCGRALRHYKPIAGVELYGTDFNPVLIEWDREHLPHAEFDLNGLSPSLEYADDRFGLIFALSVFTHLPAALQLPWLLELLRVVRPGGYLYFTTHGTHYRQLLSPEMLAQFDASCLVVGGEESPGTNHCAVFHPPAYVHSVLLAQAPATLLEHLPCGASGNPAQDSWLIRKNL